MQYAPTCNTLLLKKHFLKHCNNLPKQSFNKLKQRKGKFFHYSRERKKNSQSKTTLVYTLVYTMLVGGV